MPPAPGFVRVYESFPNVQLDSLPGAFLKKRKTKNIRTVTFLHADNEAISAIHSQKSTS